jgi:hypothetical protein
MMMDLTARCVIMLCVASVALASVDTGNMRDLGYQEPNWYPIVQGDQTAPVVNVNPATQVWGDIQPYSSTASPLCKFFPGTENGGRGSCKTDLSWIHSAAGLTKEVFSDPVVNYILRFHIEGACYRSTQVCRSNPLLMRIFKLLI